MKTLKHYRDSMSQRLGLQMFILGFVSAITSACVGQNLDPERSPELPTYMGRAIANTMHWKGGAWLVRHKRDQEEAAEKMREFLGLKAGMTVCDFGAGNGYHTFPIAEAVGPAGKVVALEIQQPFIKALQTRIEFLQWKHVEARLVTPEAPNLEDTAYDLILLVDVYHELRDPAGILAQLKTALKPEGAVVLVEYRAEDDQVPIRPEHKMSRPQLLKELAANGFELLKERTELPWQHMMWFRPVAEKP